MRKAVVLVPGLYVVNSTNNGWPALGMPELSRQAERRQASSYSSGVRPMSWSRLLRNPRPDAAAVIHSLLPELHEYQHRHAQARVTLLVPAVRSIYWQHIARVLAERFPKFQWELLDWKPADRRWSGWLAERLPGDLLLVDTSLPSGQQLWRLAASAPSGVSRAKLSEAVPALKTLPERLDGLLIAPQENALELVNHGVSADHGVWLPADERADSLLEDELRNAAGSVLLVTPPVQPHDRDRWEDDRRLTSWLRLLERLHYDSLLVGVPSEPTGKRRWPLVRWQVDESSPVGWATQPLRVPEARQLVWDHLL